MTGRLTLKAINSELAKRGHRAMLARALGSGALLEVDAREMRLF
jgi:hypothetical protein